MIAAARAVARFLPLKTWLWLGVVAVCAALAVWLYAAGRGDEREAQAAGRAKVEATAAKGRETAAAERTLDNAAVDRRLEEWNHAAEQIPDAAPDDRELRRRCRQLRDAGYRDLPECRGLAPGAQAGPAA